MDSDDEHTDSHGHSHNGEACHGHDGGEHGHAHGAEDDEEEGDSKLSRSEKKARKVRLGFDALIYFLENMLMTRMLRRRPFQSLA